MEQVTSAGAAGSGRAWDIRDFRRLWRASAVSVFGSEIGEFALPLLAIITLAATPTEVGLLRTAQFLPFLLVTMPLGVLVDRRTKRPLMILADVGRFVLIGVIPISIWLGLEDISFLYGLVFCAGCLTVLYQLADFAFLPILVAGDRVIDANGKLSATASANEIAGKGVGGLIVEILTAPIAVLVDALTYLVSAVSLSGIGDVEPQPVANGRVSAVRDAWEGLVIAVRNRFIRPLLAEATTFNFFNELFILGLLLHAVRDLGLTPAHLGLVFVAGGLGSLIGSWFGSRLTGRFGYGRVLLTTMVAGNGAPVAVIALGGTSGRALVTLMLIFSVMGVGIGIANVHAVSLRQVTVPSSCRSRVNAGYRLVSWGAVPLGASLGGLLASRIGADSTMVLGAIGVALATLPVAFSAIPRLASITEAGGND